MRKLIEKRIGAVIPFRRILYSICFCAFCVIDQRIRTAYGGNGWLETFRDLTGVVMAVLILSHYRSDDFRKWKIPYLLWTVAGIIGGIAAFLWGMKNQRSMNDWTVIILDVFLFGYIGIHMVIDFAVEKKRVKLNRKYACVWLLMMLLMIFSKSDLVWPVFYLIMFGCFYLTDYDKAEREELLQGMLDGIILSFFLLQGLAFVFRPYDEVRYKGIYFNTNTNALFYVETAVYCQKECLQMAEVVLLAGRGSGSGFSVHDSGSDGMGDRIHTDPGISLGRKGGGVQKRYPEKRTDSGFMRLSDVPALLWSGKISSAFVSPSNLVRE